MILSVAMVGIFHMPMFVWRLRTRKVGYADAFNVRIRQMLFLGYSLLTADNDRHLMGGLTNALFTASQRCRDGASAWKTRTPLF
jgi:hypothetical protein